MRGTPQALKDTSKPLNYKDLQASISIKIGWYKHVAEYEPQKTE